MRVLVADDQAKVRSALRLLLEQEPDVEIVAEAAEADDLLAQVKETRPDLVLLDWELPGLSSNSHLPILRALCLHLKLVVLSGRPKARQTALDAGADAFVSKIDPPERLLAALHGCWQDKK